MISAIFYGIVVGVILAVMIGPVFLALMSATLTEWKKKAYRFMIGNSLSDIVFAYLSYQGIALWLNNNSTLGNIIWIAWWLLFIAFGIHLIIQKEKPKDIAIDTETEIRHTKNIRVALRWFVMNSIHPWIFVFWIGALTWFTHRNPLANESSTIAFMVAILATFIVTDIIKINSAHWITEKLTLKVLDKIHKTAGVLMALAGIAMSIRAFL